ncbi:hypothetical protein QR680_013141 [Steinernema hermaphroditum]|uniref:Odorant response abnormal protein 4 n=1 Tax=Steinernema hermaphroditum TaxID=289476 RepID=A0AA39I4I3_9BILA|nr:hypothetical protein QR680_013141 [Steinernema hermaphroditum]
MLIFDKHLENYIDHSIKKQCDSEKTLKQKRIGCHFLFGSTLADDLLVAHAASCPLADAITSGDAAADQQIDPEWVADYGVRANRLLPGGVRIVGLLMIADKSFNNELRSFSRALNFIAKNSDALYAEVDSIKMAFVTVGSPLGVPKVVVFDAKRKSDGERPSKLSYNPLSWISVCSTAEFNLSVPLSPEDATKDFYSQFKATLSRFSKKLFCDETCLIDGKPLLPDDCPIGKSSKKGQCTVELVVDGNDECGEATITFATQVEILVDLNITAAVPSGSSARTIVLAAKEHLLKTLYHRAELHHESTEIIEDEGQDQLSIHQLPRVASVSIPTHPQIKVSECLFEKDSIDDARDSFRQLLLLDLEICDDEERHLNEDDLAKFSTGMNNEIVGNAPPKTVDSSAMDPSLLVGAFAVVLLAIMLFLGFKFLV